MLRIFSPCFTVFYHFCWDKTLDWFEIVLIFSTFATRLIGKEVLDCVEEWLGRKKKVQIIFADMENIPTFAVPTKRELSLRM
mgnify:CR=1 FL=1